MVAEFLEKTDEDIA